jgi:hypothetical protein
MTYFKQTLFTTLSHLMTQGSPLAAGGGFPAFTAPATSNSNAGFKRNRRSELKKRARRAAKCHR